ncbi:H-2 class I histocompatibility antigen, alpha chain-like, partial [Varanus komodoensis]|uniref:H-2 class I histocompatibility antigen, alpha chain-like n=1 Tax=Varanus komodoensis TaxID=61221 RepID=UPI001CF79487
CQLPAAGPPLAELAHDVTKAPQPALPRCPLGGFLGAQERPAPCQALERFCIHPRGALSAEPPEVTVTRRAGQDDTETLTCRAYGFYPQEIDMVWTRDGEVRQQDASREVLAPNSDGTFYAWLSVKINPWDRVRFLCRVEHDALQTPVELAWEEPASILDHLIWPTTGVLVLLPGIVLAVLSLKALRGAYGPASEILQGSYRATEQRLQEGYEEARGRLQRSYKEAKGACRLPPCVLLQTRGMRPLRGDGGRGRGRRGVQ